MDLVHVPSKECMHVRPFSIAPIASLAFLLLKSVCMISGAALQSSASPLGSIYFDLDLVAVRIAHPGRESLAFRSVIHFRWRGIHPFALKLGDHIVNT